MEQWYVILFFSLQIRVEPQIAVVITSPTHVDIQSDGVDGGTSLVEEAECTHDMIPESTTKEDGGTPLVEEAECTHDMNPESTTEEDGGTPLVEGAECTLYMNPESTTEEDGGVSLVEGAECTLDMNPESTTKEDGGASLVEEVVCTLDMNPESTAEQDDSAPTYQQQTEESLAPPISHQGSDDWEDVILPNVATSADTLKDQYIPLRYVGSHSIPFI